MLDELFDWLSVQPLPQQRPRVTISYAQSLDGSLTLTRGLPLAISGTDSQRLTHELRCRHDAILVGIGTLLADNPRLTVRLASGPDPRPVVLDTHLRIPDGCNLLQRQQNQPWIATVAPADAQRKVDLETRGARVLELPRDPHGRINLASLLGELRQMGIASLMVEGGPAVISSFLRQRLADLAVITLAPLFLGGLNVVEGDLLRSQPDTPRPYVPALVAPACASLGRDLIVWGRLQEQAV